MNDPAETIAAIATATGKGGIGVVRVSGPGSREIARQIIKKEPQPRQALYSSFRAESGELIDRGILLYFQAPASYTGEDVVEFQAHGATATLECLLQECISRGARLARPGEFTERAFHNDRLDLLQAEAVADLINSQSRESAQSAMRSLGGEFSRGINDLVSEIEELRVFTESALDFPEEEIDFIKESDLDKKIANTIEKVLQVLESARQGRVMLDGASITIVGEPNVGKSSLLNRLGRSDRAIVSSQPGTTRDVLEDNIIINGVPLRVTDTAGIRSTADEIEKEGIDRATREAQQADLVLLVLDASNRNDEEVKKFLPGSARVIEVLNKIDLLAGGELEGPEKKGTGKEGSGQVYVSAKTGEGLDDLREKIYSCLNPHTAERSLPGRARHIEALELTLVELEQSMRQVRHAQPAAELIAEDLLRAQQALESITGKTVADDLLGKIFSSFCIGK